MTSYRRKKAIASLFLLLCSLQLFACGKAAVKSPQENGSALSGTDPSVWYHTLSTPACALTDEFAYLQDEDGYLYLAPAESAQPQIVCRDPQCSHQDETCSAYFESTVYPIAREGQKIRFLSRPVSENPWALELWEMNEDGTGRQKVAAISEQATFLLQILRVDDCVLIAGINQFDADLVPLEKQEVFLYGVDLGTSRASVLFSSDQTAAVLGTMRRTATEVYFPYSFYDVEEDVFVRQGSDEGFRDEHQKTELLCVDLQTLELTEMPGAFFTETALPLDEESFLAVDEENLEMSVTDAAGQNLSPVGTLAGDSGVLPACAPEGGLFAYSSYDSSAGEVIYSVYEDEAVHLIGTTKSLYLGPVFSTVAYASQLSGGESGGGELVVLNTEDFLAGRFDRTRVINIPPRE